MQSLGLWQDIYLRAGELDSARMCGNLFKTQRFFTAHKIAGCYVQLEQTELACGNYKQAYNYARQYIAVMDSINQEKRRHWCWSWNRNTATES